MRFSNFLIDFYVQYFKSLHSLATRNFDVITYTKQIYEQRENEKTFEFFVIRSALAFDEKQPSISM